MRFFLGGYSADLFNGWLHDDTGKLELVSSVSTPENASFLVYSPKLGALYAAVETGYRTGQPGKVAAYRIDKEQKLTAIGSMDTCGAGPCHVDVDESRNILLAANYGGGSFAAIQLGDTGIPEKVVACVTHHGSSVNKSRQQEAHVHATVVSPDCRHVLVCDLGTDQVVTYRMDDLVNGRTEPVSAMDAVPGSGPRHLVFSHDSAFAYIVNELSSTITVCGYDADTGALALLQEVSTLPPECDAETTASEIQIHPSGRFVYASNRGHDSIAVFNRNGDSGELVPAGHMDCTGTVPRHFALDPDGAWCVVCNQGTDHVVTFRLDQETGLGAWSGYSVHVTAPSCVEFLRP